MDEEDNQTLESGLLVCLVLIGEHHASWLNFVWRPWQTCR